MQTGIRQPLIKAGMTTRTAKPWDDGLVIPSSDQNLPAKRRARMPRAHSRAPVPQKIIQSPNKTIQRHKNIGRRRDILDKDLKYETRVATNINVTYNIPYPTLKTTYIN